MASNQPLYSTEPGPIGEAHDGRPVALQAMTPQAAGTLGHALAAIDPWARVNYKGETLAAFFAKTEDAAPRYRIMCAGELAGAMVMRHPWLHGPYLNLIGLLPPFHGTGIGSVALSWMEREARAAGQRNLWLCVSSYNTEARRLYEHQGFRLAAELDDLAIDGFQELLMRKRLTP